MIGSHWREDISQRPEQMNDVALTLEMGPGDHLMGAKGPRPGSKGSLRSRGCWDLLPQACVMGTGSMACRANSVSDT